MWSWTTAWKLTGCMLYHWRHLFVCKKAIFFSGKSLYCVFFVWLIIRDSVILHIITEVLAETGNKKCAVDEIPSTYECTAYSTEYVTLEHSRLSVVPLCTLVKQISILLSLDCRFSWSFWEISALFPQNRYRSASVGNHIQTPHLNLKTQYSFHISWKAEKQENAWFMLVLKGLAVLECNR